MNKSVTNNIIYNIIFQLFTTFLPVITTPYISRTLGVESSGIYSFVETIVTLFTVFGAIGTSLYGCRKIAYVRDDKEKLSEATYEIFMLKAILLIPVCLIYILLFCIFNKYSIYFLINILTIVGSTLELSWFFNGVEDFKLITIRNFIIKIIFIICLFIFVKVPSDLWKYVVLVCTSNFLGNISMWFCLPRYINPLKSIKNLHPLKHLKEAFVLFIPQSANYVYSLSDKAMLGFLTPTLNNVGIYDYGYRIVKMLTGIMQSIGYVLLSRISNLSRKNNKNEIKRYIHKSISFTIFLSMPMMLGLIGIASNFIPFYLGNEFKEVVKVLYFISPLIFLSSINSALGVQLLLAVKKDKEYTVATVTGAIINIVLNFILIPTYGIYGACITSLLSEVIVFILELYYAKEYITLKNILLENKNVIASALIMFGLCNLLKLLTINYLILMLIQIGLSVLVYFLLLLLLKDPILKEIIAKGLSIIKIKKVGK